MVGGNRRNLIFRASIFINIAMVLYAAMHLSGTGAPGMEWVPVTGDGSERTDMRYLNREEYRNDNETRPSEYSLRTLEESTSQKTFASTTSASNKTASSTASVADVDKKISAVPLDIDLSNETLDIVDENALSEPTLVRLRSLLACMDRDFQPQSMQRGESFWVLKNYVRADHGNVLCHETVTYTTHAGYEYLDNVLPLVERLVACRDCSSRFCNSFI